MQLVRITDHRQIRYIDGTHIVCALVGVVGEKNLNLGKSAAGLTVQKVTELLQECALYILVLDARTRLHDRYAVE